MRRCLTPVDMASRQWLMERMKGAGLNAAVDGVANVIGTSPNPGRALLIGSHTDTQPTGGWLDGALGVMYGIEVVQALREHDDARHLAVDVASWADEEGHYLGLMGSRSFCNELSDGEINTARNSEGHPLRNALAERGLDTITRRRLDPKRYVGYVEAHIEQGPWLEVEQLNIGVVTSIVGMRDLTVTFTGRQNHAGTTPMHLREDAAKTLFVFACEIDRVFSDMGGEKTVWTIGQTEIKPNAPSIIPGFARMNLQFRDDSRALLDRMQERVFQLVDQFNAAGPVGVRVSIRDDSARPVTMDTNIQTCLAQAAERHAPGRWKYMHSGAAHDAQVLAAHLPTGMLFVPSIAGISHDFMEDTKEEDIVLGCRVLADAAAHLLG